METTITIKITADKNDWHAVIAEEREGAKVCRAKSYSFDTMPEDFGRALESYLDRNVLTPIARKLPLKSYTYVESMHTVGVIDRFDSGYRNCGLRSIGGDYSAFDKDTILRGVAELNRLEGVTPAQAKAMEIGSMFGWACPGADPDNYNDDGTPKGT